MSEPRKKTRTVGTAVDVPENGKVTDPAGVERTVTGGSYVLDQVGTFVVDGAEIEVK